MFLYLGVFLDVPCLQCSVAKQNAVGTRFRKYLLQDDRSEPKIMVGKEHARIHKRNPLQVSDKHVMSIQQPVSYPLPQCFCQRDPNSCK